MLQLFIDDNETILNIIDKKAIAAVIETFLEAIFERQTGITTPQTAISTMKTANRITVPLAVTES